MKLRYNYRLNPTPKQIELLKQVGGNTRFIWNKLLEIQIQEYNINKEYLNEAKFLPTRGSKKYNNPGIINKIVELKKKYPWLNTTYSQVLQQVAEDLGKALKVKKYKNGFPKFKSKYAKRDSFRYVQHTEIKGKYLHLPKIGNIKIKLHRYLPKYSSVTIYQNNNHWYASFVIEKEIQSKQKIEQVIGIDLNSANFATSDNELIPNPKFLKQKRNQVKGLQRKLSRKQKGSNLRNKVKNKLSKLMAQIRNRRHNFLHQVSSRITKSGVLVCVETLTVDEMRKNHLTAIAIQDAGWSNLFGLLNYKSELKGGYYNQIKKRLPSSKTCSRCGYKKKKLGLSERTYKCNGCSLEMDRDINAAINIRNWGIQEVSRKYGDVFAGRQELPPTPLDVVAEVLSSDIITLATTVKAEAKFL